MPTPVSSMPSGAAIEMALLEHQQGLVAEGKRHRNLAHELCVAAKKTASIHEAIANSERKFELVMSCLAAAVSVFGAIRAMRQTAAMMAKLKGLTPQQKKDAFKQMQEAQDAAMKKPKTPREDRIDGLKAAPGQLRAIGKTQMEQCDEAERKWAESLREMSRELDGMSKQLGGQASQDRALAADMASTLTNARNAL